MQVQPNDLANTAIHDDSSTSGNVWFDKNRRSRLGIGQLSSPAVQDYPALGLDARDGSHQVATARLFRTNDGRLPSQIDNRPEPGVEVDHHAPVSRQPLTEAARELLRQQRRQRRKKEQEIRQRRREEEQRRQLLAPKTSKINFINPDLLSKLAGSGRPQATPARSNQNSVNDKKEIKFQDLEYPSLMTRPEVNAPPRFDSSGSEWETEDDHDDPDVDETSSVGGSVPVIFQTDEGHQPVPILKKSREVAKQSFAAIAASEPVQVLSPPSSGVDRRGRPETSKRKKDPVVLDLAEVLRARERVKKAPVVLGIKSLSGTRLHAARNLLDSSAPSRPRGKERERPRKKRLSKLKKVILKHKQERILTAKQSATTTQVVEIRSSEVEGRSSATDDAAQSLVPALKELSLEGAMETSMMLQAKARIHSRHFRSYCDHVLSPDLDQLLGRMMEDIIRFQDRLFLKDAAKAQTKRRYVVGLREMKKFLVVKKIKAIVLAPDLDSVDADGGLNDVVMQLKSMAKEQQVPCFFAGCRKKLGRMCHRKVPVSGIGILNYQGSDDNFSAMVAMLPNLQQMYSDMLCGQGNSA